MEAVPPLLSLARLRFKLYIRDDKAKDAINFYRDRFGARIKKNCIGQIPLPDGRDMYFCIMTLGQITFVVKDSDSLGPTRDNPIELPIKMELVIRDLLPLKNTLETTPDVGVVTILAGGVVTKLIVTDPFGYTWHLVNHH